ncbi:MAG TPA: serine hydrolase domain-containing protein [Kineosporiaceae bacterium]|nr:serine hydrolase domain-containing protein [Kineosporiaceae bacterium]
MSGFEKQRLGRLREVMTGHLERGTISGMVTALSRHGEVQIEALGSTAFGSGTVMAPDSIFRISSMTKPVTAVAAMILLEECRLRLDEPVDGFLPELADRRVLRRIDAQIDDTVPARRPITLRDLLTFTLGYGMVFAEPGTWPIQAAIEEQLGPDGPPQPAGRLVEGGPDEWLARLAALPLIHQPGEGWMYNIGSDVVGVLIERVAGQPFAAFLKERIFDPLGMVDTGFFVPEAAAGRFTTSYGTDPETGVATVYDPPVGGQWNRPPAFCSGAGGLVSTIDDYLAFARMLHNGGRLGAERILSRPAVELMTTDHLTAAQKAAASWVPGGFDDHGWGFGVSVQTRRTDLGSVGTYGWAGGMGTSWATDPREDLIGILLTQGLWSSPQPPPVCLDFWTCAYQAFDD